MITAGFNPLITCRGSHIKVDFVKISNIQICAKKYQDPWLVISVRCLVSDFLVSPWLVSRSLVDKIIYTKCYDHKLEILHVSDQKQKRLLIFTQCYIVQNRDEILHQDTKVKITLTKQRLLIFIFVCYIEHTKMKIRTA